MYAIYISFSNDFLLSLNLSARKRLSLVHVFFSEILVTCSAKLQVLEKSRT